MWNLPSLYNPQLDGAQRDELMFEPGSCQMFDRHAALMLPENIIIYLNFFFVFSTVILLAMQAIHHFAPD